ncbi:bacillithiol biosynthesis cysteine-adding enzyme BshC [Fluviicola sp.]|jgi:bacillithiol biosynthesis cysteine-adding enzyme BshC|uniref:bacillithiol biosynthesis cysteine-adding enzyme BshC n=1 Tax=Fluviicola sp. TaxID=1917219 RepID=UPI00282129F5|nr:bacillithiol biosynthesis cysteine-adding enzyme BshC [Fluviicola sp.]MDR0801175.1 bacillithiol biosynthesis cysteine-adding enzyme BshC [Fluviicola sp.]
MIQTTISRDKIKQFSTFSQAFGDQSTFGQFLTAPFHSVSDMYEQAKVKQQAYSPEIRNNLIQTWNKQIASFASENQLENLKLLENENTFTVTTGHQLTLFGGPLYLVYKVLHVVRLVEAFNASQSEFQAVPVFWMASEDHDFDEIKSTHLFNQKLTWESDQTGPVGRFRMDDFSQVHETFNTFFEGKENEITDLLSISEKAGYAAYFQEFLSKLFADFGVLVLQPDSRDLKRAFIPVILREIAAPSAHQAVLNTNKLIEAAGYKPQAQARDCNLFYLKNGKRLRIEPVANGLAIDGEVFSEEVLKKLVREEPENFSPNVILRPVYQETILPNLVYVGGGGEMAYWIQLKGVFQVHQTLFPLIQQRISMQLHDGTIKKRLDKLNWPVERFFQPKEVLKKLFLSENEGDDLNLSALFESFYALRSEMIDKAKSVEATLESFAEAEAVRMKKQLEVFEQRLIRQLKQRHEQTLQSIDFISERIIPENTLQERYFHWLQFAPGGGYKDLLQAIYQGTDPFETDLVVIDLTKVKG